MGRLDPTYNELNLIADFMTEAAYLLGTHVKVKIVKSESRDLYRDPLYEYNDPIEIDLIIDEHPKIKTLVGLNWYNEDDPVLPILAYISTRDRDRVGLTPLKGTIIEMPYALRAGDIQDVRLLEVSDAQGMGPGSVFWVCKLVPHREDFINELDPNQDENYPDLKIPK